MRFATAIAILSQGFVSADKPTKSNDIFHDVLPKSRKLDQAKLHQQLMSSVSGSAQSYHGLGNRPLRHENGIGGTLKNKMDTLRGGKCEPHSSSNAEDVLGILDQCPPGEYCSDSGYCVTKTLAARRQEDAYQNTQDDLFGQLEEVIDYVYDYFSVYNFLCNASSPVYQAFSEYQYEYGLTCDCSDIDVDEQEGIINCTRDEVCYGDLCYEAKSVIGFDGDLNEYQFSYYCVDFSAPYEQEVCYYYGYSVDSPGTCYIGIDGVDCTSCEYDSNDCTAFDCTNIANGNVGNSCAGEYATDIFDNLPTFVQVDETISLLETILYGISRMTIDEQTEWATLTAEYVVQYYETAAPDILFNLVVVIEILAVIPGNGGAGRFLQENEGSEFVTVVHNIYLAYEIEDPSIISPVEVAQLPFSTAEEQDAYIQYIMDFGSGGLAGIEGIESLGKRESIRPEKGSKKNKKSSKKSSKGSKSSKSSKSQGKGKGSQVYHPPPMHYHNDDDQYVHGSSDSKSSKKTYGKGIIADTYDHHDAKNEKKGKRRRH